MQRAISLICATVVASPMALAGPLTPPVGVPAPTNKTLAEVEPRTPIGPDTTPGLGLAQFRIPAPGAYYLTGDFTGVSGLNGIEIGFDNVSLDLNGFNYVGVPGSRDGIFVSGDNVTVANGVISGWGDDGVSCSFGDNTRLSNLHIINNTDDGIDLGDHTIVTHCVVSNNGNHGARREATSNPVYVDSSVFNNNAATGLRIRTGVVRDVAANDNGADGVQADVLGVLIENVLTRGNTSDGIATSSVAIVRDCLSIENGADGIRVGSGSLVEANVCRDNDGDGIHVTSAAVVRGNTCTSNGMGSGAGIYASASDNHITDNYLASNDFGVDADGDRSVIIRNHARANGANFAAVSAGNFLGLVVGDTASMNSAENANVNWSF